MRDRIKQALQSARNEETEPADPTPAALRAPRRRLMALVQCHSTNSTVEGYTLNISYSGILVQCSGTLPTLGEKCEVTVLLPQGHLRARGQIMRVDTQDQRFAVRVTHLARNGYLLLAAFLAEVGTGGRIVLARRL